MNDPTLSILLRTCLDDPGGAAWFAYADRLEEMGVESHASLVRSLTPGKWTQREEQGVRWSWRVEGLKEPNQTTVVYAPKYDDRPFIVARYGGPLPYPQQWTWIALPDWVVGYQHYYGRSPNRNNAMRRALRALLTHHPYKRPGRRKCICSLTGDSV